MRLSFLRPPCGTFLTTGAPFSSTFAISDQGEAEKCLYFREITGAPEEIRTPDPQIRSLVLYPAELRARIGFSRASDAAREASRASSGFQVGGQGQIAGPLAAPIAGSPDILAASCRHVHRRDVVVDPAIARVPRMRNTCNDLPLPPARNSKPCFRFAPSAF
jgi:hypothetical protein